MMKTIGLPVLIEVADEVEEEVADAAIVREDLDDGWIPKYVGKSKEGVKGLLLPGIPDGVLRKIPWIAASFMIVLAIGIFPSLGSLFFLLAAVLIAPIHNIRSLVGKMFGDKPVLPVAVAVCTILGFVGAPNSGNQSMTSSTKAPATMEREYAAEEDEGATLFQAFEVEPKTRKLEYSHKTVDPMTLVDAPDNPELELGVDGHADIDLSVIGTHTVTYAVYFNDETKTSDASFEVMDTRAPVIKLATRDVVVEQGAGYDPKSNVTSVEDPVDGSLLYVDEEPGELSTAEKDGVFYESGWYTITGEYDENAPTKYFFEVVAADIHGNRTTKEFSVLVNKAPDPEPEPEPEPAPEPEPSVEPAQETVTPEPVTSSYILNKNTMVFHYPSCRDVKRMSEKNKVYVDDTRENIIARGYKSCDHCNP